MTNTWSCRVFQWSRRRNCRRRCPASGSRFFGGSRFSRGVLSVWLVAVAWGPVLADEAKLQIHPQEKWSNVFGGKQDVFHFSVTTRARFEGTAGWRLSSGGKTLSRGEKALTIEPEKAETIEVRLEVPQVKEGVILSTVLSCSVFEQRSAHAVASVERQVWIFPQDPFSDRREWLKKIGIHLFDPEKKTGELFAKVGIPFKEVRNPDSLPEIKEGIVVIGEGVSFRQYRGLSEMILKIAAGGTPVLCLAVAEGETTIPSADGLPRPKSMSFEGNDVIRRLDKRLDAEAWPPNGRINTGSIVLKSERGPVIGEVQKDGLGWTWLEMNFDKTGTEPVRQAPCKLVMCWYGIVEKWDAAPTPRFLLVKILEHVAGDGSREKGGTENE